VATKLQSLHFSLIVFWESFQFFLEYFPMSSHE
jgi:hypothetical protein